MGAMLFHLVLLLLYSTVICRPPMEHQLKSEMDDITSRTRNILACSLTDLQSFDNINDFNPAGKRYSAANHDDVQIWKENFDGLYRRGMFQEILSDFNKVNDIYRNKLYFLRRK